MVTTPVDTRTAQPTQGVVETFNQPDYDANPLPADCFDDVPEGMELIDGELVEKVGMTLKHAAAQGKLVSKWQTYAEESGQGGHVYPEAPCKTTQQKRRPDVAYVTPESRAQFGLPNIYPQAFPLIAEIASPDDAAEMLFEKAQEYLASGSQEVWILLPETRHAFIVLPEKILAFKANQTISTQTILTGFSIELAALFD
ncbi:Uma2 family endonuclease [filamentous cyanobacterium LEGE 11480]|uniref:Uma2 family endonuclease n=1 Tax=Romeriopsis navalis LEGE 11480 TaxID=2777977 RepID=A0A928Z5Q7_9CYAN|nr:Uma2 family endonuclease [Romeriopsis navalis]MBE9032237.1 Uma2 family endonuclease [Romeriopsis navalis LEGE 11480]